jgi:hypothetical protein
MRKSDELIADLIAVLRKHGATTDLYRPTYNSEDAEEIEVIMVDGDVVTLWQIGAVMQEQDRSVVSVGGMI